MELQNFAVARGDDETVTFNMIKDSGINLADMGITVVWKVFEQSTGVVADDAVAIITKSVGDGLEITPSPSPGKFTITIAHADTVELLGNYYHEAKVTDALTAITTVVQGIMTVLEAQ